jgi:outer membrane protein assembly factor BamD
MKVGHLALALCLLGTTFGCGAKKELSAEQYHDKAAKEFRNQAYAVAIQNYRELLDQHPFSEYTEEAELRIGQAHYLDNSCPEAIAAFTDFQRRHPTSPNLPLVGYLIGGCYERQMRPPDRDQSAAKNAHAYYLAVTQQYPTSPFADLSHERMGRCRDNLARHEMLIADFYESYKVEQAAEFRLLDLVNRFNDTDVAGDALFELGTLYQKQGADERAALAYSAVAQHHSEDPVARKAEKALAELEPTVTLPAGDPLAALREKAGRSRALALTEVVELPGKPSRPGFGGFGGIPGGGGPGGGGPFGRGGY